MFIKSHKKALNEVGANVAPYMKDGVVVEAEGYLSVMLPLLRGTIVIKFAENDYNVYIHQSFDEMVKNLNNSGDGPLLMNDNVERVDSCSFTNI